MNREGIEEREGQRPLPSCLTGEEQRGMRDVFLRQMFVLILSPSAHAHPHISECQLLLMFQSPTRSISSSVLTDSSISICVWMELISDSQQAECEKNGD